MSAGWKGVGKASKGDTDQGSGRIARWQRIADAASKQSLRYTFNCMLHKPCGVSRPRECHQSSWTVLCTNIAE